MTKLKLQGKDLKDLGYPQGRVIGAAIKIMEQHYKNSTQEEVMSLLAQILASPDEYVEDNILSKIANELIPKPAELEADIDLNEQSLPYKIYGAEKIEEGALTQMNTAMRLPVAVGGALMPDAHQGYGLPIGGVLATENAIIPYAVGVDIGCRMCLSLFEMPPAYLDENRQSMMRLLNEKTLFGAGREFKESVEHEVLDRREFKDIPLLQKLQHKALKQLGTSGSGNHFVEFGVVDILNNENDLGLSTGKYMALLSHSGSRGLGATVAGYYTKLAMETCRLPKEAKHLAWLSLDTQEGMEYWLAMNLAGDYASACHHTIHKKIAQYFKTEPLAMVENHHNFAWKEMLNGKEVIVHRKGATPASKGTYGIIPGSMTAPGFIVKGKGEAASLNSASHGAGRQLSRTKAIAAGSHKALKEILEANGVTLIGGGLDEAPIAYKDIHEVMKAQTDLVEVVGMFSPKIVKMDGN